MPCSNCAQGLPCSNRLARNPQLGAVSTASVAGVPVVAAVGAVGGGWGGWALAKKQSTPVKVLALLVGAFAGSRLAPAATDAVGL